MAVPRVFISSTCYDLAEIRDGLISFFQGFGFEVVLSERGDVFYHPDLHTHESCLNETANCQLFILIIGGRFGGKYKTDKKSITNAEYDAAVSTGTPVFAFVKEDVLSDHNVWQKNRRETFASSINYPSIEKQEYSVDIFSFIDAVRSAPINNSFFGFRRARDLHESLRKQLAGMFFDFLSKRTLAKQFAVTSAAVDNLSLVSGKIEELVKAIYRNVEPNDANKVINEIDSETLAISFFQSIAQRAQDTKFLWEVGPNEKSVEVYERFEDFLVNAGFFEIQSDQRTGRTGLVLSYMDDTPIISIGENISKRERGSYLQLQAGYDVFRQLPVQTQLSIMRRFAMDADDYGLEGDGSEGDSEGKED
jgi:hypothetical protein